MQFRFCGYCEAIIFIFLDKSAFGQGPVDSLKDVFIVIMLSTKLILINSSFVKETPGTFLNHINAMKRLHVIDVDLTAYALDYAIPQDFKIFLFGQIPLNFLFQAANKDFI